MAQGSPGDELGHHGCVWQALREPTSTHSHSGTGVSVCPTQICLWHWEPRVLCWCLPRVPGAGWGGHGAARGVPGQAGSCQEAKPPSLHCMEMRARPAASRSLRPPAAFPRGLRLGGGSTRPTARPGSRHAGLTAPGGPVGSVPPPFFPSGPQLHGAEGLFFSERSRPSQNPRRVRACRQSPRLSAPAALPPPVRPSVLVVSRNCSC